MAGMMHEPQIREVVFAPAFLGHHMMDVEILTIFQVLVADGADTVLPVDELLATQRHHLRPGSSLVPVIL
jgi:hypothetical protein